MVLQSQARLPAARAAHMYRRSGSRSKFMPAIIAIGILSLTGWGLVKLWPNGSNESGTSVAALKAAMEIVIPMLLIDPVISNPNPPNP